MGFVSVSSSFWRNILLIFIIIKPKNILDFDIYFLCILWDPPFVSQREKKIEINPYPITFSRIGAIACKKKEKEIVYHYNPKYRIS